MTGNNGKNEQPAHVWKGSSVTAVSHGESITLVFESDRGGDGRSVGSEKKKRTTVLPVGLYEY